MEHTMHIDLLTLKIQTNIFDMTILKNINIFYIIVLDNSLVKGYAFTFIYFTMPPIISASKCGTMSHFNRKTK